MNKSKLLKFFTAFLVFVSISQAQTGGNFTITQSVVAAGGGQQTSGGTFSIDGTIGQAVAGDASSGVPFSVICGFWTPQFAPTSATSLISGRIIATDGIGIRNVIITLTNTSGGELRVVRSSAFGYYKFEDIPVGETYILTSRSKRFAFQPETRIVTLLEELTDIDFMGLPQ